MASIGITVIGLAVSPVSTIEAMAPIIPGSLTREQALDYIITMGQYLDKANVPTQNRFIKIPEEWIYWHDQNSS